MFVHLHTHSPYSFLDGASTLDAYVEKAAEFQMPAVAITDHSSLSSTVEFYKKASSLGILPIQGVEILTQEGFHMTLLAQNPCGYQNLCRILTDGYAGNQTPAPPQIRWSTLRRHSQHLFILTGCRKSVISQSLLRRDFAAALEWAQFFQRIFPPHKLYLEMIQSYLPRNRYILDGLEELHKQTGIPLVATNNVHYHNQERFPVHDLLTCIRTKTTLADVNPERPLNNENDFASPDAMKRRFADYPQAVKNTLTIAESCQPAIKLHRHLFPQFCSSKAEAYQRLEHLTWTGAQKRYGQITQQVKERLSHELHIIQQLDAADYFLAVWDIIQFAQKNRIRYAGRGSAADSAVAYCLEITDVDAIERELLFERFLSLERAEKPDIDIDFDAQKRDRVIDYVYNKYPQHHTAAVCTFSTYRARSALQDLAKAFGFTPQQMKAISRNIPHAAPADGIRTALEKLPELRTHPLHTARFQELLDYCEAINAFPRHIGTHLGGLVISGPPLTTVTPLLFSVKGTLITQFDKNTIEDLGLIKLDLLSLRTLSAVHEVETNLHEQAKTEITYPANDQATYRMINQGDSTGVFQLESPAQRSLQTRLTADNFDDLVASVALIRPGPIRGNMVDPFIQRRQGLEPISYIDQSLKPILEKTYGVVLFQEQVIEIATKIAGFTPGEADALRRVMTHFRSQKEMDRIGASFVAKAKARHIPEETAETVFSYIAGYAGYGFCEAHAAAFADTAYKTAYLLRHYPAYFYAALLNNQPMGFYSANTLCVHARQRNIELLPLDINCSSIPFYPTNHTIRIGLKQVKGIRSQDLLAIQRTREEGGAFSSLADCTKRLPLKRDLWENLILAGAFDSFCANRRLLLWQLPLLLAQNETNRLPLAADTFEQDNQSLQDFSPLQRWLHTYQVLRLHADRHIMEFARPSLQENGWLTSKDVRSSTTGPIKTAGLVIRPHRPPTRSGKTIIFLTLEDEYGFIDVTIFEHIYRRFSKPLFHSPLLKIIGQLTQNGNSRSLTAHHIEPLHIDGLTRIPTAD